MKRIGVIFAVLPMLICVVLFSIGFASWSVVVPPQDTHSTGIGVSADNVYYSADYVKVKSIDVFDYTSLHFLASGAPSEVGYITVNCEIDLDACHTTMTEKGKEWDGTLDVSIALFYSNALEGGSGLFSECDDGVYYRRVTASVEGAAANSCTLVNNGAIVDVEAELSGLSSTGKYSFDIKFALNIPENLKGTETPANFRYLFGQYLKNTEGDKTVFIASARVVDVE